MADLRGYVEGMIGFEGGGTTVVANPTGTPTDDLESIQIEDTIYNVGGSNIPTPTDTDRGKYLGVKSNANELEYREVNEVPNITGVEVGNVLTRTTSGYMWSAPESELPSYSTAQNDKVLGVHNGALEWVEQSGGGSVEYSTNEHVVGTWIDGRDVYEKTIYYASLQGRGSFLIDDTLTSSDVDIFLAQDVSYIVNNNYISGIGICLEVCINTRGVYLDNNNAPSGYPTNFTNIYVTIRYVKKL